MKRYFDWRPSSSGIIFIYRRYHKKFTVYLSSCSTYVFYIKLLLFCRYNVLYNCFFLLPPLFFAIESPWIYLSDCQIKIWLWSSNFKVFSQLPIFPIFGSGYSDSSSTNEAVLDHRAFIYFSPLFNSRRFSRLLQTLDFLIGSLQTFFQSSLFKNVKPPIKRQVSYKYFTLVSCSIC